MKNKFVAFNLFPVILILLSFLFPGHKTSPTPEEPIPSAIFSGSVSPVNGNQSAKMLETGSWKQGCPIAINDLRVVSVSFWDFDGDQQEGEIMVHKDVADDVLEVFQTLYDSKYPIKRIELVDNYDADDELSMQADNTSGFNCRLVPNTKVWSEHAYGKAIDLNPFENPEVRNGKVDPIGAERYKNRSLNDIGMIKPDDAAIQAFASIGWKWGGNWTALKDYQHFSLNGK